VPVSLEPTNDPLDANATSVSVAYSLIVLKHKDVLSRSERPPSPDRVTRFSSSSALRYLRVLLFKIFGD
jgi:hypothetical protein